jgi:DNA-binding CsgD family transcriptional regulator
MTLSPTAVHNKVLEAWSKYYPSSPPKTLLNDFIEKIKIFDQLGSSNIAALIFGYHDFNIYYINEATSNYFGMASADILEDGFPSLISCIDHEQTHVALEMTKNIAIQLHKTGREDLLNDSFNSYANWKITSKKGVKHRVLVHIFPVMLDENNLPLLALYLLYDMKPFLHPDKWWCRNKAGDHTSVYLSEEGLIKEGDIISPRELEVLRLLEKGLSSKAIAQELNLSSHTVDNHRRNMLLRSGAMDTSSLVYVCKLCRILPPIGN